MARRALPEAGRPDPRDWVCLAVVGAPKGVRGAVRLTCFTDRDEDVLAYGPLHAGPGGRALVARLLEAPKPGQVVVAIEDVGDRDAAARLTGQRLYVPRDRLPEPEADEFYHHDLIGMTAEDPEGRPLGRVHAVFEHGAGDILEIVEADGRSTFLVPFTREAVPEVDLAGRRLVVVPPEEA